MFFHLLSCLDNRRLTQFVSNNHHQVVSYLDELSGSNSKLETIRGPSYAISCFSTFGAIATLQKQNSITEREHLVQIRARLKILLEKLLRGDPMRESTLMLAKGFRECHVATDLRVSSVLQIAEFAGIKNTTAQLEAVPKIVAWLALSIQNVSQDLLESVKTGPSLEPHQCALAPDDFITSNRLQPQAHDHAGTTSRPRARRGSKVSKD